MQTYTISQLAQEFGITTRALRFYEDKNLLTPSRQGRNRVYDHRDHTRLKLVLRGKRLGFSLDEIGGIMSMYDGTDMGEMEQLKTMVTRLQESRQALTHQQDDIKSALEELDEIEQKCRSQLRARGLNY